MSMYLHIRVLASRSLITYIDVLRDSKAPNVTFGHRSLLDRDGDQSGPHFNPARHTRDDRTYVLCVAMATCLRSGSLPAHHVPLMILLHSRGPLPCHARTHTRTHGVWKLLHDNIYFCFDCTPRKNTTNINYDQIQERPDFDVIPKMIPSYDLVVE